MTLFINNLPHEVTEVDVLELFEEYGAVKHIFLPTDWKTNQVLGFAFVEMSVKAREEAAKFELNGSKWMGNQLQISEVSSQDHTQNRQGRSLVFWPSICHSSSMPPLFLAMFLVSLLTLSGNGAIAYLFPDNHPQD